MFLFLAIAALVVAFVIGYAIGRSRGARAVAPPASGASVPVLLMPPEATVAVLAPVPAPESAPGPAPQAAARSAANSIAESAPASVPDVSAAHAIAERARLIRAFEAETARLRRALVHRDASLAQLKAFAAERRRLFVELADARAATARWRQLVVDLENNAPPPLLGGPGMPDDLKLIVGVGPMLERMLFQLGVTTYRQIARWTERDIDEFDAKLPEFPGRIRRDGWVTQARSLHQSKYGAAVPPRDRA